MTKRCLRPATWIAMVLVVDSLGGAGCQEPVSQPASGDAAAAAALENCPASLDKTIGASCTMNGLVCGPTIPCGLGEVTISCMCSGGAFRCLDALGNTLTSAAAATCPAVADGGACPRSEKAAALAACSETGLLCAYPSACPGSFDQCQCFPGTTSNGGFGLRFECRPATCTNPDAAVIRFDAGSDATTTVDSGASGDATIDAARGRDSAGDMGAEDSAGDVGAEASAGDVGVEDSADAAVDEGWPPLGDAGSDGGD